MVKYVHWKVKFKRSKFIKSALDSFISFLVASFILFVKKYSQNIMYTVFRKKHPLTFYFISP